MLLPRHVLIELDRALKEASGPIRVASVETDVDPLDLVRSGAESFGWAGFYTTPDGRSIGGLGTAASAMSAGAPRFGELDLSVGSFPADAPVFVGFAFDEHGPTGIDWGEYPCAAVVVPEISIARAGGRSRLTVAIRPGSDERVPMAMLSALRIPPGVVTEREVDHTVESRPAPSDWRDLVREAIASIGAGAFDKVVLARSVLVHTPSPPGAFDLVAQLRDRFPDCRVFGWQQGDSVFLGASPELLVTREGERFQLNPLAGSAPRGHDADEDRRLGDALLASVKDRLEHSIVVEDALARLEPLVDNVTKPADPILQRFDTVQHLATPITGSSTARVLQLAGAVHPTPAVGGAPRDIALGFIAKQEGLDRGWYSGGIGWVTPHGDGDIAVALRCALVRGDHAIIYAGNGIVEGSDPDDELAETRLKLRPMLELLTGS